MLGFRMVECPVTFRNGEYVRLEEMERMARERGRSWAMSGEVILMSGFVRLLSV